MAYLRSVQRKMLYRIEEETKVEFVKFTKWLRNKNELFDHMMLSFGDSYLRALYVLGSKDMGTSGSSYAPTSSLNRDTEKVAAYYRYTTTDIDLDADTFKEAISKGKYKKGECFINSIYDFYGDNLMRPDKNAT